MDKSSDNVALLKNICFNEVELANAVAPDEWHFDKSSDFHIPSDFVLCRDADNNATAIFGDNRWDFNPYRLSANRQRVFNFDAISKKRSSPRKEKIIGEMKVILFHLMYSLPAGHTGMLTVGTLYNYFGVLTKAAKYCFALSEHASIREITLETLFSDELLFTSFIKEHQKPSFNSKAKALVNHLLYLGEKTLKFDISEISHVDIDRLDNDQTVVIPQRIYLTIADNLDTDIQRIFKHSRGLASFLSKFKDPFYGLSEDRQKGLGVGGEKFWRPNMNQAIKAHGLSKLFSEGDLIVSNRNNLQFALAKIQYLCKLAIHFYTGMRHQEVQRLQPKPIHSVAVREGFSNESGKVVDKGKMVEVISTTTKFTSQRVKVSWFAPIEVKKAVTLLQRIHKGLSLVHGQTLRDDWLFITTEYIKTNRVLDGNFPSEFKATHKPIWLNDLIISELDYKELVNSDDSRDWALEEDYQIGEVWPLHSHQFRRSLAYYASNAGFVSQASLKSQFKHLTRAMTRYYGNNFEKAESIFGFYNERTGEFELPPEHIIKEFRTGIPFNVADHVISDLLRSEEPLYGKTGSYTERQSERLRSGEVIIEDVRTDTVKRVQKGELAYRETLLGGCTKVGECDNFMLGNFIGCLPCNDAAIKSSKIDREIEHTKAELARYKEDSGEYQLTKANLDELLKYKKHRIDRTYSKECED